MTPIEAKAKELIDKHREFTECYVYDGVEMCHSDEEEIKNAKQAALITVEEIMKCTWKQTTYNKWGFIDVADETKTEYWQQVKEAITKM